MMYPKIKDVAVVDDDDDSREETVLDIEGAGYSSLVIQHQRAYNKPLDLVREIRSRKAHAVVCDHRLAFAGMAGFTGAEIAAALYDEKIPCILVTTYADQDYDVSIRKYRRKVPVLLKRSDANKETIRGGIDSCCQELYGDRPLTRKPHSTIMTIKEIALEGGEKVVDVIIPAWDHREAVRFPADLIPNSLKIKKGLWLIADVNIGAEKEDDLYFENFRLAPEPVLEDELS